MLLQLTDEDILLSDTASSDNCPIARGLRRTLGSNRVFVHSTVFYVGGTQYQNTSEMRSFIRGYDKCRAINRRTFKIPYDLH